MGFRGCFCCCCCFFEDNTLSLLADTFAPNVLPYLRLPYFVFIPFETPKALFYCTSHAQLYGWLHLGLLCVFYCVASGEWEGGAGERSELQGRSVSAIRQTTGDRTWAQQTTAGRGRHHKTSLNRFCKKYNISSTHIIMTFFLSGGREGK